MGSTRLTVKISRIFDDFLLTGNGLGIVAPRIKFVWSNRSLLFLAFYQSRDLATTVPPLFFHEVVSRPATWETTDLACDSHCHGAPLRYESSCNSALNDLQKTCLLCEPIAHRVVCVVLFAIIIKKSWGLSLISSLAYRSNGRFFLSFFLFLQLPLNRLSRFVLFFAFLFAILE